MSDPTRTAANLTNSTASVVSDSLAASSPPPSSADRYHLGAEIARGGMGVVYRSTDTVLRREVAVKVLQERFAPDSGTARRFFDEARITGQLQHPGIPPVHDLGTLPDGRPFLAMKLIKGETLDVLLANRERERPEFGRWLPAFEQVCHAVAYAHAHGVIHRDLKPANVMVGSFSEVQVMDWGLAKVLVASRERDRPEDLEATTAGTVIQSLRESDGSETQAGSVLGTPAFMPPEQAVGALSKIDARSDVFGLGAILAVILTGQPPFAASSAETTRVKAAQGDVADCFARLGGCGADPELVSLCKRCLSPKPADRPADADEVAKAVAVLRAAADERAKQAELDRVAAELKTDEHRKRRKLALVGGGILCGVLLAGVIGTTIGLIQAREAKEAERLRADGEQAAKEKEEEALRVATSQIDLSYDALGDLILKIQQDLDEAPGGRHIRKELLEDTMKKLSRLVELPTTSDRFFRRHASAHMQLGEVLWGLNRQAEAEAEYKKAGEYAERAFRANPTSDKAKANVAVHNNRMGDCAAFYRKQKEPARKYYEIALALWQSQVDKLAAFPVGDPALPELERTTLMDTEEALADTFDRLGLLALRFDFDYAKAEEWFAKSLTIRKSHLEKYPSYQHRVALGALYIYMAEMEWQRNELAKVVSLYRELVKQREATFAERSWSLKARRELADAQGKLGDALVATQQKEEGHRMNLASRDLYVQVLSAEPNDPQYRSRVAHAHYRCGTSFLCVGDPPSARREFEAGLKLRQAVYDEIKDPQQRLNMQPSLMFALARSGRHAEAAEMAASVRKNLGTMPVHVIEAGTGYGLCMAAVGAGKPPEQLTAEEKQLRVKYMGLAIECFAEVFSKQPELLADFESGVDVDPFRDSPEFKRWLESFRRSLNDKK